MESYNVMKFLHVLAVVFMAAPLYNLIVVNERVRFGKAPLPVDRYFESIIRGNSTRCFVFQLTAFVTGIILIPVGGHPLTALVTNWVLLAKLLLLLTLTALLSWVHFAIQPRIDGLLSRVQTEIIPPDLAGEIAPLRGRRKRLAATCLFLVVVTVLLGVQVFTRFHPAVTVGLILLAALFSRRVYASHIPYGWA